MDIIPMGVLATPITIIGAGAIGGWVTLALAKMGCTNLTVFDGDKVDTVNLNSQFYRFKDVGRYKVEALKDLVQEFTGVTINENSRHYESGIFPGLVICAVDSMSARSLVWKEHAQIAAHTQAILDPRMGAETALLYVMNPTDRGDVQAYEKSLYSDSQAVQERCTAKATIYTANLLAGLVVKAVKDVLTQPNYLRTVQWDIAANELVAFSRKVS
jgi:molybdopterin/thiamine biosynthesis adenylyltransferase